MRRGMRPTDACLETLKRVLALTPASRLNPAGRPLYQIQFYAANKRGEYGCAGMYPTRYAACDDGNGPRELDGAAMFEQP
jgi:N4-(beta-N-acetylglucosaminyl)-L-asparaginase